MIGTEKEGRAFGVQVTTRASNGVTCCSAFFHRVRAKRAARLFVLPASNPEATILARLELHCVEADTISARRFSGSVRQEDSPAVAA